MHRHLFGSVIADICSTKPEASTMQLLHEALVKKTQLLSRLLLLLLYRSATQPLSFFGTSDEVQYTIICMDS
jgi:hypothetical protein